MGLMSYLILFVAGEKKRFLRTLLICIYLVTNLFLERSVVLYTKINWYV